MGKISINLLAAVCALGLVFGQTANAKVNTKATSGSSVSASALAAPIGAAKTSTALETVKAPAKKWSVTLLQETYVDAIDANHNKFNTAQADAFIGVGYKLNETQKLEIRQNFTMNQTDARFDSEYALSDPAILFKDSNALQFGENKVASDARIYLPVNENSRKTGKIEARYGLAMDKTLAKGLTLTPAATVRAYMFTINQDAQNGLRLYMGPRLAFEATSFFTPYVEATYNPRWYHNGVGVVKPDADLAPIDTPSNVDYAILDIGADFTLGPIGLTIYVEQVHNIRDTQKFQLGTEKELAYSMILSTSM